MKRDLVKYVSPGNGKGPAPNDPDTDDDGLDDGDDVFFGSDPNEEFDTVALPAQKRNGLLAMVLVVGAVAAAAGAASCRRRRTRA